MADTELKIKLPKALTVAIAVYCQKHGVSLEEIIKTHLEDLLERARIDLDAYNQLVKS